MRESRCFPSLRCYGFCGSLGDRPGATPLAAEGSVGLEAEGACVPAGRLELIRDPVTATKEHLIGCLAVEGRVRNHCIVLMDVPSDELLERGEAVQLVKEQPMVLQRSPPSLEFRVGEGDLDLSEDTSQGVKSQQVSPFKVAGRVGPSAPSYFPHFADLISQAFPAPVSAADLLGLRQQRSMWQRRSRGGAGWYVGAA
jgi:hypothetical protein